MTEFAYGKQRVRETSKSRLGNEFQKVSPSIRIKLSILLSSLIYKKLIAQENYLLIFELKRNRRYLII